jgi:hypothetical protein
MSNFTRCAMCLSKRAIPGSPFCGDVCAERATNPNPNPKPARAVGNNPAPRTPASNHPFRSARLPNQPDPRLIPTKARQRAVEVPAVASTAASAAGNPGLGAELVGQVALS